MRALVLLVCGCNQILGLGQTAPRDAQYFDVPIDAPFTCPALGTAPKFRHAVHSLPITDCWDYSISHAANRALAACANDRVQFVGEGVIEGDLVPAEIADDPNYNYFEPRLAANGQDLTRIRYSLNPQDYRFQLEVQHRDVTWSQTGPVLYDQSVNQVAGVPQVSNITTDRHMLLVDQSTTNPAQLHELVEGSMGWQEVDSYPVAMLYTYIAQPTLTSDGLRLVFMGSEGVRYADRASTSMRFTGSVLLDGVPSSGVSWPMLDDNCGKLYFSAIGSIFFLEQD